MAPSSERLVAITLPAIQDNSQFMQFPPDEDQSMFYGSVGSFRRGLFG